MGIFGAVGSFFKSVGTRILNAWKAADTIGKINMVLSAATFAVGVKGFLQARNMLAKGQDIMANKVAAGGKIPVIYGTRRVGAQIVYMDTSQNRSKDLFVVYALCVGEVEQILGNTIELDGNAITDKVRFRDGWYLGSDKINSGAGSLCTADQVGSGTSASSQRAGQSGTDPTKKYRAVFNLHHGAASQTADPMLRASIGSQWTTAHRLDGIAYIAASFEYDTKGMWKGVPQLTVQVKGRKVFDPRTSTTGYSDNAVLCFLDFIRNNEYGKGIPDAKINMTTFSAAANLADTQLNVPYYNGNFQNVNYSARSGDSFITITNNEDWWQNKVDQRITLKDSDGTTIIDDKSIDAVTRYKYFGETTQDSRVYFDGVVPPRDTTADGGVTLSATNGDATITVTDNNHGAVANDEVLLTGAVSLGGNITAAVINQVYTIATVINANSYTIEAEDLSGTTVLANSSDTGNGGNAVGAKYQYKNDDGTIRGKSKRFTCNGHIDTNKNVMDNAKELLANMRGIFTYFDGKYELKIEDTGSASFNITDAHIIEDNGISVDYGNKDAKANKVIVEFFNANKRYELDTATVFHNASPQYFSDDGDEILEIKAEFPYVTSPYIAYNMAKTILTRSRNQTKVSFLGTAEMYKLNIGDIVDLTYAGLGFSSKVFIVEALELQPNGLVGVSLLEYFDVYTWEVPPQEPTEPLQNTPSAYAVSPPDNVAFTDTNASPTGRPRITWDAPTDYPDYEFRVAISDSGGNALQNSLVETNFVDLNFIPVGSNYVASVTSINSTGSESNATTLTFSVANAPIKTVDIQANAITANEINVTNLAAIESDLGDIDAGSINIGSGAFIVTSSGAMTATNATVTGNITASSLNVTGATVTGTIDASKITLNGDPLTDIFALAGSGQAKTLSLGGDTKNLLKVDGIQLKYFAFDQVQNQGTEVLKMDMDTLELFNTRFDHTQITFTSSGSISAATLAATSFLTLGSGSAPSTTTNRLYNVGGSLFFNGTQLGTGTGDITAVVAGTNLNGGGTSGSVTLNLDSTITGNHTFSNNLIVGGDLTVQGTTTTIDTTNLDVKDKNITLNFATGDSSANANGAGITIQDAVDASTDATILWDNTNDEFDFSHGITLPDNQKLQFGAGNDLQIFHDSSDSFIKDAGDGNLNLDTNSASINLTFNNGAENMITASANGAVVLYHDNAFKLATDTNGVNVSGLLDVSSKIAVAGGTEATSSDGSIRTEGGISAAKKIISGTSITAGSFIEANGNISTASNSGKLRTGLSNELEISHNGSHGEIDVDTGNLTLDVAGDIILDADGGDIVFNNGGTEVGRFLDSSTNLVVKSAVSDADLIFKGNDGGSSVTALTLDMSDAGAANFNAGISIGGQEVITSSRKLNNITGFSGTSTVTNGYDFNCTDSTANTAFTGMVLDHNASGSDTLDADRTHRALFIDQDSSATGGDTSNEHRLYGLQLSQTTTGDSDLVYGINILSLTQHTTGITSALRGINSTARANTTAQTNQVIGVTGTGQTQGAGTVTSIYGGFFKSHILSTNTADRGSAFGVYAEVENDSNTTLTNADAVRAVIDRDNGTITNGYLFRGSYEGTQPTNAFGVYISSDVRNFFAGDITIGNTSTDVTGINVQKAGAQIAINDSNDNPRLRFRESGTTKSLIKTSSGSLILTSGGTATALTLDTSQNATFAGTISGSALQSGTVGTTTNTSLNLQVNSQTKLSISGANDADFGKVIFNNSFMLPASVPTSGSIGGLALRIPSDADISGSAPYELEWFNPNLQTSITTTGTIQGRQFLIIEEAQSASSTVQFDLGKKISTNPQVTDHDAVINMIGDNTHSTGGLIIKRNAGANNGSSITSKGTGDLTLDVGGDINLDAAGGQVRFKNDGTTNVTFNVDNTPEVLLAGGNAFIGTTTSDADFTIFGSDGGSNINALVFDMSNAGAATFNSTISSGAITASGDSAVGGSTNISMSAASAGQLRVFGAGYTGSIALDGNAMHVYHNSSSRDLILGTNETARLSIGGTGTFTFHSNNLQSIGTISSGEITTSGNVNINTANDGLYFSGGNNRIYFNDHRAMEGATNGGNLQIAEGYTTILAQADVNISPTHTLDMNGTTVIDSSRNLTNIGTISSGAITSTGTVTADTHFTSSDSNATLSTSGTGGTVRLRPNGSSSTSGQLTVQSTGNVGIGNDSPSYKFDVYGEDDVTMRIHRPNSGLASTDSCGIGFSQRGDGNTSTSDTRAGIFSNYNGDLFLAVEAAGNLNSNPIDHSALFIEGANANVGIGTTSPDAKIDINVGSGSNSMRFQKDSQETYRLTHGTSGLFFTRPNSTALAFGVTQDSDFKTFDTSGNTLIMSDASTSRVGIGTTSPSSELHVKSTDGEAALNLEAGTVRLKINTNNFISASSSVTTFAVNGSEKMRIDSSGNVGIGTTSPSFNTGSGLEIERSGTATLRMQDSGNKSVELLQSSDFEIHCLNSGANVVINPTSKTIFETGSTERMRIDAAGNIQMGATPVTVIDSSRNLTNIGTISSGAITTTGFFNIHAAHTVYAGIVNTTSTATTSYNVIRFTQGSGSGAPTGLIGTAGSAVGNTAFRSGMNIGTQTSGSLNFIINDGLAARIDTSGNFQMGTTTVIDSSRNLTNIGTISSGAITSSGDITLAANLKATGNNLKLFAGGNHIINMDLNGNFYPQTHNAVDLGFSNSLAFRDLHLSGSANIGTNILMSNSSTSAFMQVSSNVLQFGTSSDDPLVFFANNAEKMRIDTSGRVGIGETSPDAPLHITSNTPIIAYDESDTGQEFRLGVFGGAFALYDSNDTAFRALVDGNGNVGIGETSPDKLLHLKSSGATGIVIESTTNAQNLDIDFYNNVGSAQGRIRYAEGTGAFSFAPNVSALDALTISFNGEATFSNNVTAFSDERLKENIQTLDGKKALQMRGVSFTKDGKEGSGVIAQEIEKIAPELVLTADDEQGTKSVAYGNLVGYLIEAIKDQQKQIDELKAKLDECA